jgi:hypothetical protein
VLQSTLIGGTPFTYPGDAYVMRARADIASATTIGDPDFVNPFAPDGLGVAGTNYEAGKVVWIYDGKGAGQSRNVGSNTSDTLGITSAWDIIPDSTSHFMVLEPNPMLFETDVFNTDGLSISDAILGAISVPFSTQGSQSFLVQIITEDAAGNISPRYKAPWQEVFVPAQHSSSLPDGLVPVPVSAGNALIDLANGLNQELTLDGTTITVVAPIFTGGVLAEGSWFTLYLRQQAPGNHALPVFTNAAGAFSSNVAKVIIYTPDAGTDSPVTFTFRGGYWIPDSSGALPT